MPAIIAFSNLAVDPVRLDEVGSRASIVCLAGEALASMTDATIGLLDARAYLFVAIGEGRLSGRALAAALTADWLALRASCTLDFGAKRLDPLAAGAAIRRIGGRARGLLLSGQPIVEAPDAVRLGLADALVADGEDSLKWLDTWLARRSVRALVSGSALSRRRGGDRVERAEFSRLFAEGEPQRGLKTFLEKRPLDFSNDYQVVTI